MMNMITENGWLLRQADGNGPNNIMHMIRANEGYIRQAEVDNSFVHHNQYRKKTTNVSCVSDHFYIHQFIHVSIYLFYTVLVPLKAMFFGALSPQSTSYKRQKVQSFNKCHEKTVQEYIKE